MTNDSISCSDISNSDDRVWEAACLYEDGDVAAALAMVAPLSATDRALFGAEVNDINRKRDAAQAALIAARAPVANPMARSFINPRAFEGQPDYEGAILTRDLPEVF